MFSVLYPILHASKVIDVLDVRVMLMSLLQHLEYRPPLANTEITNANKISFQGNKLEEQNKTARAFTHKT